MYYSGSWGQSWSSLSIKREISVCLFFTYLENCASDLLPAGRMLQTRWSAMSVCEVVWMSSHSATAAHLWSKVGLHQYCSLLMTWQCILILSDQTVTLLCGSNTWGRAISRTEQACFERALKKSRISQALILNMFSCENEVSWITLHYFLTSKSVESTVGAPAALRPPLALFGQF